jgi:hypothetical protein
MSKGMQLWPGDKMRAFFRAHIKRETPLDAATAERLSDALTGAVNRMLIWQMPEGASGQAPADRAAATVVEIESPATTSPERQVTTELFNPYLFSVIVVLAKFGRDGLMKRLHEIKSVENLRAFAEAQHVPVEARLKRAEDIRKAIATAAEQRLADRKAAAS